jgi:hypothetical protein
VVFGSFFILNLALAVLYLQFSKDKEKRLLVRGTAGAGGPGGCRGR